MDTETLIKPEQNNNRTYFIVFDTQGKIHKINSSPVSELTDDTLTQIESTNPVCKKLLKGTASIKKFGIIWDVVKEKWDISRRNSTLVLESNNNKLLPFIFDTDKEDTEIFVNIFYNDGTAVIYANRDKIKSIKNLSDIKEITTEETDLLDIYITKQNDPDYLIAIIKADPLTLFKWGEQVIKLDSKITNNIGWQKVSMYTKPVFKNYGWNLIASENQVPASGTNTVVQTSSNEDKKNININVVDNKLTITSMLDKQHESYFEGQRNLRIIVCNKDPDNFIGSFNIPVDLLFKNKSNTTIIDFKWPEEPLLLYKNNYVTISTGEKNVK